MLNFIFFLSNILLCTNLVQLVGKEFTIKFVQRSSAAGQHRLSSAGSEDGSVYSDAGGSGDIKITTLMADDAEVTLTLLYQPI